MSFRAVAARSTASLSTTEQKVITVLLSDATSELTAAEIASRAGTHESTVVRLAKKLGYRGYPDLRRDLRVDESQQRHVALMRSDSGPDLASFIDDELAGLSRVSDFVHQHELDAAARTISEASVVYIFANGDSRSLQELLGRRLRRVGIVVVSLTPQAKDLAERFVPFDSSSVLIGFALRETPRMLPALIGEVSRRGGKSLIITDVPGAQIRPAPDQLLAAARSADSEYRTLFVPMAISYGLQLAIYHLDRNRYHAIREDIDGLTRMLGGTDEIPIRS
ncbi:MurR/RpiR family transcriptional regulator [Microbacterium sp. NPDC058342]|uniref:MurR/RpiR family transcriptional regulator n=1 Tax=Microbacterium sp. NPDC058342 TaxID=3346454 RepID=UPI0036575873